MPGHQHQVILHQIAFCPALFLATATCSHRFMAKRLLYNDARPSEKPSGRVVEQLVRTLRAERVCLAAAQ